MTLSMRLWITAGLLLGSAGLLHALSHGEEIIPREPLSELPYSVGVWKGEDLPLSPAIVAALNVTDHANRAYLDSAGVPVQLYIGYYASQRTGDTIHSPKNCLPGSGWEPIRSGTIPIKVEGRQITVNEYVIQKEQDREIVFYWYQDGGRVIASEYAAKFWMISDAISRNRTDGALVRVVTASNDGETNARRRLIRFTQVLFPRLSDILPN
ncbi:MAG: exosortase C-terminal domain/associated protein EpsI [Candidatus Acidiferrum sp.]